MSTRRVLPSDANGPRFRIVRLWRVGTQTKAERIGDEDTPAQCMHRIFIEGGHVIAVDRRGDIYADNHRPSQERT